MRYVRGLITDSKIVVQADRTRLSAAQVAEHELYHSAAETSPGTNWYCEQKIKDKYGEKEFNKVVEKYIEKLRGIIDIPENVADYFEQHEKQDKYSKVYDSKVLSIEKVEIKIEPNGSEKRNQQNAESYLPPLGSVVSIRDLLGLVNGDTVKYIPKPASNLTNRGKIRKASIEDWEKAENVRFSGVTIKAIHMFLRALQKAVREYI